MKKALFLSLLLIISIATVTAKEMFQNINQVSFYLDDTGYFAGPRYPKTAGTYVTGEAFPYPGGRTYAFGPWVFYGEGIVPPPSAEITSLAPDLSDIMLYDIAEGGYYYGGAWVVTNAWEQNVTVNSSYVINTFNSVNYTLGNLAYSTETDGGGDLLWYQNMTYTGNPSNKWPYNDKKYAYTPSSLEPLDTDSDAFLNAEPGTGAYMLYVVNPSAVTSLHDYVMVYDGVNARFNVYQVTGYTSNDAHQPTYGSTVVDTVVPGVGDQIGATGIYISMNAGAETPLANGDSYIIRAHGTLSDMDFVLPYVDTSILYDGSAWEADMEWLFEVDLATYPNRGPLSITHIIRAYSWTASYLDTTVVFDITFENTSSEDYNHFAAGISYSARFGEQWDDVVRYVKDENLILLYDMDGIQDSAGTSGADSVFSSFTAARGRRWHEGDFGTSPYAMLGIQIMKPLTIDGMAPPTRFTLNSGYSANYYTAQNGAGAWFEISGGQYYTGALFTPIVTLLPTGPTVTTNDVYYAATPYSGVYVGMNRDAVGLEAPRTDNSWNSWTWGQDLWDDLSSGYIIYAYHPDTILGGLNSYFQWEGRVTNAGNRRSTASVMFSWYLGEFNEDQVANVQFAIFAVQPLQWGWTGGLQSANGRLVPDYGESTFDAAIALGRSLQFLGTNRLSPSRTANAPIVTTRTFTNYLNNQSNRSAEVIWQANSESTFGVAVDHYIVNKYDGISYKTVFSAPANKHPVWATVGTSNIAGFDPISKIDGADVDSLYRFFIELHAYMSYGASNILAYYFTQSAVDPEVWIANRPLLNQFGFYRLLAEDRNINVAFRFAGYSDLTFHTIDLTEATALGNEDLEGGLLCNNVEDASFAQFIFINSQLTFGYHYKYQVQAIDAVGLGSSLSETSVEICPSAVEMSVGESLRNIKVVPNPLIIGTIMDKTSELTHVKFNHMPTSNCTIKIFTVAGELVRVIEHTSGLTWASWDLLTRYNQEVAPGLYIYVITAENGEKAKGTFSIIR